MQWVIRQSKDNNLYWKEIDPKSPEGIGVAGTWLRGKEDATRFSEDRRLAYIAEKGDLTANVGFYWEVVATRHQDALDIQNACNPAGIALALHEAFREVIAEGGDTKAQREDPACRLILHQLAYLLRMSGGYDIVDYNHYVKQCESKVREGKGQ